MLKMYLLDLLIYYIVYNILLLLYSYIMYNKYRYYNTLHNKYYYKFSIYLTHLCTRDATGRFSISLK